MTTGRIRFLPEYPAPPAAGRAAPAPAPEAVLGLPPIRMILAHGENEPRSKMLPPFIRWLEPREEIDVEQLVHRIIDHLKNRD